MFDYITKVETLGRWPDLTLRISGQVLVGTYPPEFEAWWAKNHQAFGGGVRYKWAAAEAWKAAMQPHHQDSRNG